MRVAKNFECQICNRLFTTQSALKKHDGTHTDDKLDLKVDGKILRVNNQSISKVTEKKCLDHKKSIKLEPVADGKMLFKCKMCPRKYATRQWKAHRKSYHKRQKLCIECTLCGKIFKDGIKNVEYKKLRVHEGMHRKQVEVKASKTCKECQKRFQTPWKLRQHMVIHDKERVCHI